MVVYGMKAQNTNVCVWRHDSGLKGISGLLYHPLERKRTSHNFRFYLIVLDNFSVYQTHPLTSSHHHGEDDEGTHETNASTISRADKHTNTNTHIRMWENLRLKIDEGNEPTLLFRGNLVSRPTTLVVSPLVLLSLARPHEFLLQSVELVNLGRKLDWLEITGMATLTSMIWRLCCRTMAGALGW